MAPQCHEQGSSVPVHSELGLGCDESRLCKAVQWLSKICAFHYLNLTEEELSKEQRIARLLAYRTARTVDIDNASGSGATTTYTASVVSGAGRQGRSWPKIVSPKLVARALKLLLEGPGPHLPIAP